MTMMIGNLISLDQFVNVRVRLCTTVWIVLTLLDYYLHTEKKDSLCKTMLCILAKITPNHLNYHYYYYSAVLCRCTFQHSSGHCVVSEVNGTQAEA